MGRGQQRFWPHFLHMVWALQHQRVHTNTPVTFICSKHIGGWSGHHAFLDFSSQHYNKTNYFRQFSHFPWCIPNIKASELMCVVSPAWKKEWCGPGVSLSEVIILKPPDPKPPWAARETCTHEWHRVRATGREKDTPMSIQIPTNFMIFNKVLMEKIKTTWLVKSWE